MHNQKICMLTAAIGDQYKKLQTFTSGSMIKYCNKYGYNLIIKTLDSFIRPASWYKIPLLLKEMKNFDFLIWIGCDMIITNNSYKIESFIDNENHFFVGNDENGMNCDLFIIKNCDISKRFLIEVWKQKQFIYHGWWEQASIRYLIENNKFPELKVRYLEQNIFQSKGYNNKSFTFHPAGQGIDFKLQIFSDIYDNENKTTN